MGKRYTEDLYLPGPSTSTSFLLPSEEAPFDEKNKGVLKTDSTCLELFPGTPEMRGSEIIIHRGTDSSVNSTTMSATPSDEQKSSNEENFASTSDEIIPIQISTHRFSIPKALKSEEEIKVMVLHSLGKETKPHSLSLYEAFGIFCKESIYQSSNVQNPLIAIEINESDATKRYLVPLKYSMEPKWIFYGRRIYIVMGHSFVELRSSTNGWTAYICILPIFRPFEDYYRCLDCGQVCLDFTQSISPCEIASILTDAMNFPYDYYR